MSGSLILPSRVVLPWMDGMMVTRRGLMGSDPVLAQGAPIGQAPPHFLRHLVGIERLGVEPASRPAQELGVPFMVRIGHSLQKLLVARSSAYVLWRAAACASQAHRVAFTPLGLDATFKQHVMPPAVSKVVLVLKAKPLAAPAQDFA